MNYEYKKELPEHGIIGIERLNELGARGWDNYAVHGGVFYFKKELNPLLGNRAKTISNLPELPNDIRKKHK